MATKQAGTVARPAAKSASPSRRNSAPGRPASSSSVWGIGGRRKASAAFLDRCAEGRGIERRKTHQSVLDGSKPLSQTFGRYQAAICHRPHVGEVARVAPLKLGQSLRAQIIVAELDLAPPRDERRAFAPA